MKKALLGLLVSCLIALPTQAAYSVFAWNDLGMHCIDDDFSVMSILPPFNNLYAQVVNKTEPPTLVTTGVSLTYEAVADSNLSINSYSRSKTNFWLEEYSLLGMSTTPDVGLLGNPTVNYTPELLKAPATGKTIFSAEGIPVTPYDDSNKFNALPMTKVSVRNSTGVVQASTNTVLPVSNEISCGDCHSSGSTQSQDAKPVAGWVFNADPKKDWRFNILRLHDDDNKGNPVFVAAAAKLGYGTSLEASAINGKPVFCASCHTDNLLTTFGLPGTTGISPLTRAMHGHHAATNVTLNGVKLDSGTTRNVCYECHPGKTTQCLRGAMGTPVLANGQHEMECQSCHGTMAQVAATTRSGWFSEPKCETCHNNGTRLTKAYGAPATTDTRFAINPKASPSSVSLYRTSTGHGGLSCEACHNSTHAEFPSTGNDGARAIALQGYNAAIRECTVCHLTLPKMTTANFKSGPHGMHIVGQTWVSNHPSYARVAANKTDCFVCHGSTSAGSPLAVVKIAKTFNAGDSGNKTFAAGTRITCWSCHNGPNGG